MHVGKIREEFKCQPLYIDNWKVEQVKKLHTGENILEDNFVGKEELQTCSKEKYLGEIISEDGSNFHNIKNIYKE